MNELIGNTYSEIFISQMAGNFISFAGTAFSGSEIKSRFTDVVGVGNLIHSRITGIYVVELIEGDKIDSIIYKVTSVNGVGFIRLESLRPKGFAHYPFIKSANPHRVSNWKQIIEDYHTPETKEKWL